MGCPRWTSTQRHAERRCRPNSGSCLPFSREGPAAREHPPARRRDRSSATASRSSSARVPGRGRAGRGAARRAPARHPLQHQGHAAGARRRHRPAGGRLLLHRHQPGRPRRRRRARHRGVQRAVLQHPQRRRARHRRDHRAGPPAAREDPADARRHLGQVGQGQPRGPRPHARHRRLRQHRHPAVQPRRGARLAGDLLRHRRPARARQRPPGRHARRAARRGRRRHACTSTGAPATPGSSAPTSSRR